jgi:opacity protein-like surface antigen
MRLALLAALALLAFPQALHAQTAGEGWRLSQVTVYGWLPSITGAQQFPDGDPVVDLDSSDVLEALQLAFFGTAEVRNGRLGLVFDLAYVDLGQDGEARGALIPGGDPASASVDTTLLMATAVAAYRFAETSAGWVDVYGGLRFTDLSADVSVDIPGIGFAAARSASVDWVDAIVGLRGHRPIADRWSVTGLVDVGGFGIGSSSRLTWQVQGMVDYAFTDSVIGRLGYRYMNIDYRGSRLAVDADIYGPVIGVTWTF